MEYQLLGAIARVLYLDVTSPDTPKAIDIPLLKHILEDFRYMCKSFPLCMGKSRTDITVYVEIFAVDKFSRISRVSLYSRK